MLLSYLKNLKEKSKLTSREIAEKSGVPESTVNKILSGQTESPNFQAVADIVRVLGGSLDTCAGLVETENMLQKESIEQLEARVKNSTTSGNELILSQLLTCYENRIIYLKQEIQKKEKWINKLFLLLAIILITLFIMVIFDLINPNFGLLYRMFTNNDYPMESGGMIGGFLRSILNSLGFNVM